MRERSRHPPRRGLSLIEVLVVISVLALLISLVLPSLTAARQEGLRMNCLANLKTLGGRGQNYGVEDPRGILHPQSEAGDTEWIGLGGWDWGGADGEDPRFNPDGPVAPLSASTRRFNLRAHGAEGAAHATYQEYHCPGDRGESAEGGWRPSFSSVRPAGYRESMFLATGNSYLGDYPLSHPIRVGGERAYLRFGTFMRPVSRIPAPAETLLFYETVLMQAILSAEEMQEVGHEIEPLDVVGWHGRVGEFNAVMADGHVQRLTVRRGGTLYDPQGATADRLPYQRYMPRGPGWRYDAMPECPLVERFVGSESVCHASEG
jgi:prepilin-type N-terminal cleavage/methylation domain-containing protein/prepilin-type processing-associated H-X9-DG protein